MTNRKAFDVGPAVRRLGLSDPAWSTELTTAATVYGIPAQIQIIRHLRLNGPSTRHAIAESTGLNYGLTTQCLNKLKSAGVVTVTAVAVSAFSTHEENPRTRNYVLEPTRADALFEALATYLNEPKRNPYV